MQKTAQTLNPDRPISQERFGAIIGISRQAVAAHVERGTLQPGQTLRVWLLGYCEHIRIQAAGRGGADDQAALTRARAAESEIKAAVGRLEYHEKLGTLVPSEDAERALCDWAGFVAREVPALAERIIQSVETEGIALGRDRAKTAGAATIERIRKHAVELAGGLTARLRRSEGEPPQ